MEYFFPSENSVAISLPLLLPLGPCLIIKELRAQGLGFLWEEDPCSFFAFFLSLVYSSLSSAKIYSGGRIWTQAVWSQRFLNDNSFTSQKWGPKLCKTNQMGERTSLGMVSKWTLCSDTPAGPAAESNPGCFLSCSHGQWRKGCTLPSERINSWFHQHKSYFILKEKKKRGARQTFAGQITPGILKQRWSNAASGSDHSVRVIKVSARAPLWKCVAVFPWCVPQLHHCTSDMFLQPWVWGTRISQALSRLQASWLYFALEILYLWDL